MTKLFAIAGNTFIETIRQPIYGILMWVGFGMLVLNPSIAAYSLESGSDSKIMIDVGLSTLLLYGLLAAVFSAVGVITREIESFTVLTVVSKPVSRPLFLCGKFLGVATAMLVSFYFLAIVFLMTVRHGVMETNSDTYDLPVWTLATAAIVLSVLAAGFGNFVYGWQFSSTLTSWVVPLITVAFVGVLFFDRKFQMQAPATDFGDWQVIFAVIGVFLAVLILTAFAVTFATRFSQVVTLLLCAGVFWLGLLSDYYFGAHVDRSALHNIAYHALPNFQFFWFGDAITQEQVIPARLVGYVASYAGLYVAGVLGLGVAMFQTREVG